MASNVFNSLWVLTFVGGTPASTVASCPMLFGLLASIVAIAWRTGAWQAADAADRTWVDVALVDIPFSIYSGWCTVAAIVNVSAAGVACGARHLNKCTLCAHVGVGFARHLSTHCERTGWKDNFLLSGSGWAAVMIGVAGVVNISYLFTRSDPVYPLVYIWACSAIHTKHRTCLSKIRAQAESVPGCLSCSSGGRDKLWLS